MKKHTLSKFIALAMAGTLLLSPLTAFAQNPSDNDDGTSASTSASGNTVGNVDKEIYKVVLPTDGGGTFDYFVDPQDLLNQSADVTSSVSGNLLYFTSSSDADFNDTSADLTVVNKSSVSVDVTVSATTDADEDSDVTLAEDDTFADAPAQSIYLALSVSANGAVDKRALAAGEETSITKTLADAAEYYDYGGNIGSFTYVLDDQASNTYDELSFNLSGACNASDEWADDAVLPTINLVWGFEKAGADDNVITSENGYLTVSRDGEITVNLTKAGALTINFWDEANPSKKYGVTKQNCTVDVSGLDENNLGIWKAQITPAVLESWEGLTIGISASYADINESVSVDF